MQVNRISAKNYVVQSDSGKMYKVQLTGESASTISCSCPGFAYRRQCKHVDAVKELLAAGGKTDVRAKRAPADPFSYIVPYKRSLAKFLKEGKDNVDATDRV